MLTVKNYRLILAAWIVTSLLGILIGLFTEPLLPPELLAYQKASSEKDMPLIPLLFLSSYTLISLIALIIATFGLFRFRSYARTLFLILTFCILPIYFFMGPWIETGYESPFYELSSVLTGLILGIIYFSPLRDKFRK